MKNQQTTLFQQKNTMIHPTIAVKTKKKIFHSILTIILMLFASAAIIYTYNPAEINLTYKSPSLLIQLLFLILKIYPLIYFSYNIKDTSVKYEMLVYLLINVFLAVVTDNLKKLCRKPRPDHLDRTLRKLCRYYSTIPIKNKIKSKIKSNKEFTVLLDRIIKEGSTSLPSTHAAESFFTQYVLDLIYSKRYNKYNKYMKYKRVVLWLVPVIVSLERVCSNKHRPADTICGALIGLSAGKVYEILV